MNTSALPYPPHPRRLRLTVPFFTVAALIVFAMLAARAAAADTRVPTLQPKPGYVIGCVVNMRSEPLSNVTISVAGTTFPLGLHANYEVEVENGHYELEVPDGSYYVYATLSTLYNGQKYKVELHPFDDKEYYSKSNSKNGIVKNFFWKLSGLNSLRGSPDYASHHHGGSILLQEESDITHEYNHAFPKDSTVQITLTPQGPLIDGSQGRTLSFRATAPGPPKGTLGIGTRGQLGSLLGIPIGRYIVSAELTPPGGRTLPVGVIVQRMFGTALAAPSADAFLDFAPKNSSSGVGTEQVLLYMLNQDLLSQGIQQKNQEEMKTVAEKNKADCKKFLDDNSKKAGVKTTTSGLQYKVIKEGKGDKPKDTDVVETNYRGTTIDGKDFDSSAKHGSTCSFPVNGLIKGWSEALKLMPVGSKWELYIPSDLAYGDEGYGDDIPPGSTLVFEVELIGIKKNAASTAPSPDQQPKNGTDKTPASTQDPDVLRHLKDADRDRMDAWERMMRDQRKGWESP
jgi:FKBP-type peptidyl-prolyl cis-trans isomerase